MCLGVKESEFTVCAGESNGPRAVCVCTGKFQSLTALSHVLGS